MSSRRVPLQSNPNAANSPYRTVAAAGGKQKRSYATIQREEPYGQQPPAKKQMVKPNPPSAQVTTSANVNDGRVFTRKSTTTQPTSFTRKLEAVRGKSAQQPQVQLDTKTNEHAWETIRQWQRHYRKVFPKFVFYFESIPHDARLKFSKQVTALGAREEKFFSNAVTHVVTSRSIPPELDIASPDSTSPVTQDQDMVDVNLKTINPLLLDRSSEREAAQLELRPAGAKFTFEAPSGRRVPSTLQDVDLRRQQPRNNDVLHRARALGIKIWAVEKLERMMTTMFETESSFQVSHGHNTRSNATQNAVQSVSQSTREADLLQLLRNERIHGPSDRDPTVASKEMVIFKGPFIYIHDIDEKQKPIMVREYAKVQNKEDGDWPQFRSVSNGRCPFVEEVEYDPCERLQRAKTKESKQRDREPAVAATKDTAKESVPAQAEKPTVDERALQTIRDGENLGAAPVGAKSQGEMMPPPMDAVEHSSKGVRSVFLAHGVAQAGRLVRGEPVASGVQPSNITSAIRSQAISSTAAAPGAKAGTSREVHGLQRKVLEKNSGSASQGQASSHRMTDLYNVVKEDPANRPVTRKSKLDIVDEEAAQVAARENAQAKTARASVKPVEKPAEKKAPAKATGKMGYCENCMETFPDFNEHAQSRKHRRFAENMDNWKDLDALLVELRRPTKDDCSDYY